MMIAALRSAAPCVPHLNSAIESTSQNARGWLRLEHDVEVVDAALLDHRKAFHQILVLGEHRARLANGREIEIRRAIGVNLDAKVSHARPEAAGSRAQHPRSQRPTPGEMDGSVALRSDPLSVDKGESLVRRPVPVG